MLASALLTLVGATATVASPLQVRWTNNTAVLPTFYTCGWAGWTGYCGNNVAPYDTCNE